jgi:nucleoside 2-deoxyribosyltransferase
MKIFCSYAFTGEDLSIVDTRMRLVVDSLNSNGHEAYCNKFDPAIDALYDNDDIKGIFADAFRRIEASDAMVVIITSANRSVGQIMEIGLALSQHKPIYLFEHISAKDSTYLPRLADNYQTWSDDASLRSALEAI